MRILQRGKANTIIYHRTDPSLSVIITVVDPVSGATLATPAVTPDTTSAAVTSIARNATTITTAPAVTAKNKYRLVETAGAYDGEIEVIAVSGFVATLKRALSVAVGAASIKGVLVTASYTPPTTLISRRLAIIYTSSDGSVEREEALLVSRQSVLPITVDQLLGRYPRLKGQEPTEQTFTGESWRPQIQEAWDQLREDFLEQDIFIDEVMNTLILREVTLLLCGKIISEMGISPSGFQDRAEERRYFNASIESEMTKLFNNRLLLDTNNSNVADDTVRQQRRLHWDA